jgi:DNA integrity scanning protein DisA with diadenylate cyclase activity
LTILTFLIIQMHIYYQFPLENLHTLMERTIHFGVIKCVVIYSLSILAYGKL